ncbi:MAG: hypothetical protein K8R92_00950 [Planctomycetes bacterium]|nr:hypothetical protein [Planctomycetota bacterium]
MVSTRLVDVIENIDPSKISGMKEFPQEVLRVCEGILAGSIGQRKRVFEHGTKTPLVIMGQGETARAIHESDVAGTVQQWTLARKCSELWRRIRTRRGVA